MAEEGRVVIHVEVATDESQQIKETQARLAEIEKTLYRIRSSKTNRQLMGDTSGAPIRIDTDQGPIFRGQEESEEVSTIYRKGNKNSAVQRQDAFKNLAGKLDDLEDRQSKVESTLEQIAPILLSGNVASGAFNSIIGKFKNIIPVLSEALIAGGLIYKIVETLFEPGSIFDRRWREVVTKLVINTITRSLISQIRQGFRSIRMSSWIGPRGAIRGQVGSTLGGINRGQTVYSQDLERLTKGSYP